MKTSNNFLLALTKIMPLKDLKEIIPEDLDSVKESAILLRLSEIKNHQDKKSFLFNLVQEVTNPLFKPPVIKEVSLKTLKTKETITTKFTYLGQGLYRGLNVFINSQKESFLTSQVLPNSPIPGTQYILDGLVNVSKTNNWYYKINTMIPLEKVNPAISYCYKSRDDKTLYFLNKENKLFSVKIFYNAEQLFLQLEEGNYYYVLTDKWKTYTTLTEIIPATTCTGTEETADLTFKNSIDLIFSGKKEKSLEETLYWLKDKNSNVYFITVNTNRDYDLFDTNLSYSQIEELKIGENVTMNNVILRASTPEKYSLILTDLSKIN